MLSDLGGRAVSSDDATFLTDAVTRSREPCDWMNDVHVSVSCYSLPQDNIYKCTRISVDIIILNLLR